MIDRKYLPSKKFVLALSTAVALVLIALGISYLQNNSSTYSGTLTVNNASSTIAIANSIDSDGDGIPDWQEVLYGTDPHNPDTDGDGTPDGIEIKGNRDPLKANTAAVGQTPNDQIDPTIVAAEQKEVSDYESLNPTDKMAHDLFSNIIANEPSDGNIDSDTMNNLVSQAVNELPTPNFTPSTTLSDLNIVPINPDPTKAAKDINTYEIIYLTQTEEFIQMKNSDLAIIQGDIAKTDSITDTKALQEIINAYIGFATALKKAPIPGVPDSTAVAYHLELIQDIEKLAAIDSDIIIPSKDSASVFSDLNMYNTVMTDLAQTIDNIDTALGVERK